MIWYLFNRASLLAVFALYIETVCVNHFGNEFSLMTIIAVLISIVAVLPAQWNNQSRLCQSARIQDASVIDESTKLAARYFMVSMFTATLFVIFFCIIDTLDQISIPLIVVLFVGLYALSGYLSFNLLMLLTDLKVSSLLLDQLFILADCRALSLEKFNLVRDDIRRRVNGSRWASDFILVPCIVSAVVIAVVFQTKDIRAYNLALLLVKELLFVAVAFWYVAKVNERADELTKKLSGSMWRCDLEVGLSRGVGRDLGSISDIDSISSAGEASVALISDTERLTVCSTALADPISFTLLFRRLSLPNILVSFAGFAASIVAGLLRQAILA